MFIKAKQHESVEPKTAHEVDVIPLPYESVSEFLLVTRCGDIVLAGQIEGHNSWELRAYDMQVGKSIHVLQIPNLIIYPLLHNARIKTFPGNLYPE